MQNNLKLILILLSSSLVSCRDNWVDTHYYERSDGKFIKEIPITKEGRYKGQQDSFYGSMKLEAQQLKLQSLETGFETAQIRLWLGHSMASSHQVIILKLVGKYWHAELVSYEYTYENRRLRIKSHTKRSELHPANGWKNLIDSLNTLNIMNLPNANDLPNYNGASDDGIGYFFEIATRNSYRFYYYANPEENSNKFWQAKNVLTFSQLLEDEFNFEYIKGN